MSIEFELTENIIEFDIDIVAIEFELTENIIEFDLES